MTTETAADRAIKAYLVQEDHEGTGGIVYAETNTQARRIGAEDYNAGEPAGLTCRRAPEFDALHGDPRAIQLKLLDKGWWFDSGEEVLTADDRPFVTRQGDVYRNWCAWLAGRERQISRRVRDERIRRDWSRRLWADWWFASDIRIHVEPSGAVDAHIELPYLHDGVRLLERDGGAHFVTRRDLPAFRRAYRINLDSETEFG